MLRGFAQDKEARAGARWLMHAALEAGVETLARRAQAAPAGSFAGETVDLGVILLSAAASA